MLSVFSTIKEYEKSSEGALYILVRLHRPAAGLPGSSLSPSALGVGPLMLGPLPFTRRCPPAGTPDLPPMSIHPASDPQQWVSKT